MASHGFSTTSWSQLVPSFTEANLVRRMKMVRRVRKVKMVGRRIFHLQAPRPQPCSSWSCSRRLP